ncbi:MAG: hypothetical protein QOF61_396 [Acidobacteriota bacterium]|nr:hypothetical protein [Acidobacteriota bacterium]
MARSSIRFSTFPQTEPPPAFTSELVSVFEAHEPLIATLSLAKGLTSDAVLSVLRNDLVKAGFEVEGGKRQAQIIERPVFYGENGIPTVRYQIDAYHREWKCALEIEAGRAWMGNAVYRDLIQASVMVNVDYLVLAVPQAYKYLAGNQPKINKDYDNTRSLAEALYGHTRFRLPYNLIVLGY